MKVFAILSAAVIAAVVTLMFFAGVFDQIDIVQRTVEPLNLVYREHTGAYQGVRFVMNDVYKYIRLKHKINVQKGFGIFYDDPRSAQKEKLRFIGGCILDSLIKVEEPYKTGVFKSTQAVVGEFPIRSFFSYTTGVLKFYPELAEYIQKNSITLNGPIMEVYDMSRKEIIYIAPFGGTDSPAPPPPAMQ